MIYNHWDSYPQGLGETFLSRIKERKPAELLKARNNITLGRCDNYWIENFTKTRDKPQRRDSVTQKDIDEGCYIEFYYIYDIDDGTLDMDGNDYKGLRQLENKLYHMPHLITKKDEIYNIQPLTNS